MKIFMKDSAIILDLDDTLVATHYRQYRCIQDYLTGAGLKFIGYEEYFQLRRSKNLSNTALLKTLPIKLDWEKFNLYYLQNIETEKYLALDKLIADKGLMGSVTQKGFKLILLSLRSNPQQSARQLQNLGIDIFFNETFFLSHSADDNPKIGILDKLRESYDIIAFCGDSTYDYQAAVQLNINFVQVETALYQLPNFANASLFTDINKYFLSIL